MKRSFEHPKGVTTHILKTIVSQGWEGRKAFREGRECLQGGRHRQQGRRPGWCRRLAQNPRFADRIWDSWAACQFDLKLFQRSCDFALNHKMESLSFKQEAFSHRSGTRHPWREGHLEVSLGDAGLLAQPKSCLPEATEVSWFSLGCSVFY